jgi:hypothetical protein
MDRFYLALTACLGGIAVAIIGWLDSREPFDPRKLGASAIRSLIAGIIFAVGYKLTAPLAALDLLWAFLGGTGFDVAVNRVAGALGNGSFPLPKGRKQP